MTFHVQVLDGHRSDLYELRSWLMNEDELRGRVQVREQPSSSGQLGTVVDTLAVVLDPGAAALVLVGSLVSWLRSRRTSSIRIMVKRPDGGELEVSADRMRNVDRSELAATVADLTRLLSESSAAGPNSGVTDPDDRQL